jgi:asparagine synthase (glutamine-hydrolysing)
MCGIAGRLNFDETRPIDRERLTAMTSVVAHRGPDADGFFIGAGIGLGHRRLSIIDLSTGDQPVANEDRTIWTVYNGEIYNFAEIRTELVSFGHHFRTNTDTEVIVHGYEQWGDRVVDRFRGMFAFALWDDRKRRLLLVRDRLGVKPLYYCATASGVAFGSEIKSLLEDPDVPRDWSPDALDAYLTLQYVPCPHTIYRAISKLPPGHLLVAERGRVSVTRYWDLTFTGDGNAAREDEYLEQLDALVSESVRLRLVSDVPLGAFLSGGIDSSAVVAAMADSCAGRVVTTTVGFDEQGFSELEYARTVARHLGVEQHEKIVRPDIVDLLPKIA